MITLLLIRITDRIKPLLIRVFPIEFLRDVKKILIRRSVAQLDERADQLFDRAARPDGVNLIGFIQGEIGLGQSCRLVADTLQASGQPFTIYNYRQVSAMRHGDHSWDHKITDTLPYNINLIHINPYELPLAYLQLDRNAWDSGYNIAFWLWELEKFPEEWLPALKLVDEVWTPSEFASESVRKMTNKPVCTIPYPISAPIDKTCDRAHFGLPKDVFLTLCMYDCNSTMERKNPMGAIKAYKQAFAPDDTTVGLVIKINNPQREDLDKLHREFAEYPNVYILDGVMDKGEVNALIATVDVFITLHRAEGFGLVPAEAMLLGTPVIATNWSSNTEFMNHDVACMVDYTLVEIQEDIGPYKAGNRWAEPDIAQAAKYLKQLYRDKRYYDEIVSNGKNHIKTVLSLEQAVEKINARIQEIYREQTTKGE